MSVESVFEDIVRVCEFYADPGETFEVDSENYRVMLGGREISPLMENGQLITHLVIEPDGVSTWVDDLDSYFQRVFEWRER